MRYIMFIKHPGDYDISEVPPALFEAMGPFVEKYAQNGMFVDGAGLKPLRNATQVRITGGKLAVTDGPFTEAKEVIGGYSIIEAPSHAAAVELATEFMELHRLHWPGFEGISEIREFEG